VGGSGRSWWPCSCQGEAGHVGCQRHTNPAAVVMPPWHASGAAGLQGMMAAKNLPPPAAGREVVFETVTSARGVHTLHNVLPPARSCGGQQSPSRLAGCSISQGAALLARVAFRVLAVTSRLYSKTTFFPAFSIAVIQWWISLHSVQNIDFVEPQYISSIYLPNTTLYFNPVLGICVSSLVQMLPK